MTVPLWFYGLTILGQRQQKIGSDDVAHMDELRALCPHSYDSSKIMSGTATEQIPTSGPGTARASISKDLEPFYSDDEIAIVGINTARSLTFKNGRVSRQQVARSCARLEACGENRTRVIVSHHPFDLPETHELHGLVGRAHMAMAGFARCRVDLILSGHLHISRTSESAPRYKIPGHSALVIHAGTATSTRARGDLNSFNIIQVDRSSVSIQCLTWNRERSSFFLTVTAQFQRTPAGWSPIPRADAAGRP